MAAEATRARRWKSAMAWTILVSLVFRVFMQAYPPAEPIYQYVLSLSYGAFAGLIWCYTDIRRQRGFQLMTLCLLWAVFTSFFHTYEYYDLAQLPPYFYMMLFAFCLCYPLAFVLPQEDAERAYAAIAAAFVAAVTLLSAIGVYAAVSGIAIPSLARGDHTPAALTGGRLSIFAYPTVSAVFCALALLLAVYLFLRKRNALSRTLCVIAGVMLYVAMALTDGRTASIFCCACLGGAAYLIAERKFPIKKNALRTAAALCMAAIIFVGSYAGMRLTVRAVNALSDTVAPKSASVTITALADPAQAAASVTSPAALPSATPSVDANSTDAEEDAAKSRSLLDNLSTLQGRTLVWQGAIRALRANPRLLLIGASPIKVMEPVMPYIPPNPIGFDYDYYHMHSIYFQTLVAFGLPGFLLFGAMTAYLVWHAMRVFFLGKNVCSLAERTLPLLMAFCLGVDFLEAFLTFNDVTKMSNPLFFLTAGYVVYMSVTRLPKKAKA